MRVIEAKLVRHYSRDGLIRVDPDQAPLGTVYLVDAHSRMVVEFWNTEWQTYHRKEVVLLVNERAWVAVEVLDIGVQ
jgi:hypothetical protein